MFVKFSCDCIGIVGIQGYPDDHPLIIYSCDSDDGSLGLYSRDMSGKTYEPLSEDKVAELVTEMTRLMAEGYRFRDLKRLLR